MRLLIILALVSVVIGSGCVFAPSAQGDQIYLELITAADVNQSHTFEVWVVDYPSEFTVRRSTGGDYTEDVGPGLGGGGPGDAHTVTAIEFPDSARLHTKQEIAPGQDNLSTITDLPQEFGLVIVIYQEDHVVEWVTVHCNGNLVFVEVSAETYGGSAGYNCQP